VKLVHLVSFIAKKFVTMHGHMNGGTGVRGDEREDIRKEEN
jgi:hypothetical protein